MSDRDSRRAFLGFAGVSVLWAGCREQPASAEQPNAEKHGQEVGATEDLMREHGVIRRVLVVYREAAGRLRSASPAVPPDALQRAAKLMRTFGEDYHEKQLEEAHIFPALAKNGGPVARMSTR